MVQNIVIKKILTKRFARSSIVAISLRVGRKLTGPLSKTHYPLCESYRRLHTIDILRRKRSPHSCACIFAVAKANLSARITITQGINITHINLQF